MVGFITAPCRLICLAASGNSRPLKSMSGCVLVEEPPPTSVRQAKFWAQQPPRPRELLNSRPGFFMRIIQRWLAAVAWDLSTDPQPAATDARRRKLHRQRQR